VLPAFIRAKAGRDNPSRLRPNCRRGACGFVGSELASALLESSGLPGLEIIGIDNLSRRSSWRNLDRLRSLDV
jgi:hypothetical protein